MGLCCLLLAEQNTIRHKILTWYYSTNIGNHTGIHNEACDTVYNIQMCMTEEVLTCLLAERAFKCHRTLASF